MCLRKYMPEKIEYIKEIYNHTEKIIGSQKN